MARVQFGWVAPVQGVVEGTSQPYLIAYQDKILPAFARYFDSFWAYDHFYGFIEHPTQAYFESWTTLTWLAAQYPETWVGPVVFGVGYRNPALVSKMSATLQSLSGGRVVLGLGAGWRGEEHLAYGYPFPKASTRIEQLEEAVRIIRLMWTDNAPSFVGKHYQIENAFNFPLPVPLPPIMIGGTGEKLMLPLVARLADWWNIGDMPDLATYEHKKGVLMTNLDAIGRDPASLRLTVQKARRPLPETSEQSERWLDELIPLVNLGFTYFMLDFGAVKSVETIERFSEEVIQPINRLNGK